MNSPRTLFIAPGLENLRILARLTASPATGEQLQRDCQCRDPIASVETLRKQGHNITTHRLHRLALDGSVTHVALYVLKVSPAQRAALSEGVGHA
jgi:Helix-turn-helix domain